MSTREGVDKFLQSVSLNFSQIMPEPGRPYLKYIAFLYGIARLEIL